VAADGVVNNALVPACGMVPPQADAAARPTTAPKLTKPIPNRERRGIAVPPQLINGTLEWHSRNEEILSTRQLQIQPRRCVAGFIGCFGHLQASNWSANRGEPEHTVF